MFTCFGFKGFRVFQYTYRATKRDKYRAFIFTVAQCHFDRPAVGKIPQCQHMHQLQEMQMPCPNVVSDARPNTETPCQPILLLCLTSFDRSPLSVLELTALGGASLHFYQRVMGHRQVPAPAGMYHGHWPRAQECSGLGRAW